MSQAMTKLTPPAPVTLAEFDDIFEAVKNWGRWGPDDEFGTLNYVTADTVRAAAATVRSGRRATMSIPLNTSAGPDNPSPVVHHVVQGHDIDIGSSGVTFATDYLGLAFHGDCHTHMDALCHIAYRGQVYNGWPALEVMTTRGRWRRLFSRSKPVNCGISISRNSRSKGCCCNCRKASIPLSHRVMAEISNRCR